MPSYSSIAKAAVVQAEPVWLDADATISKSIEFIERAAREGAEIIAFPEVFIPGYPWWIWLGDQKWAGQFVVPHHEASLELGDERMKRLQIAAARNSIAVVMGYCERQGATRYMSQVFIDAKGTIVGNRRKLKPTHMERTVYGEGDGTDFLVHEFPFGRVGALNCWEHFQPLSKFMMYSLHEQIHVASWPSMSMYQPGSPQVSIKTSETVTCSYAIEGACFVLCSTQVYGQAAQDRFCDTEDKKALIPIGGGFARIFGPGGDSLAEPLPEGEEGILYADLDLRVILEAKAAADPVGHYARPDVLSLLVNANGRTPVRYLDGYGNLIPSVRYPEKTAMFLPQRSIPLLETERYLLESESGVVDDGRF
jgi:predicted amidohydrolase